MFVRIRPLLMSACILLLTGCGLSHPAITVSNLTGYEKAQPDASYDPQTLANADQVLNSLKVVDRNGQAVDLRNTNQPILFEAYWCPHCQRTLVLFQHNPVLMGAKPIVISCGFPKNTTLKQAIAASDKEFQLLGLSGFTVYYVVNPVQLPGYPTLLFHKGQAAHVLIGEHTSAVWEQAVRND
ncbi:hypothetical protein GCM10025857_32170 [Alicyclobacillus contaminans]|nr:hypothetical protein GCM10025857_32170 [Alicyclobacillus contaminans]